MSQIDQTDSGSKVKKQSTRVDMAPLVDLGFLLITFFMFTTTFSKPNIVKLNMPPQILGEELMTDKPEVKLHNSISLILGDNHVIYWHQQESGKLNAETLNKTDYSKDGLRQTILDAKKKSEDEEKFTILIKPTDDSTYQDLINVIDEMEITSSKRYAIVDLAVNEQEVYNSVK